VITGLVLISFDLLTGSVEGGGIPQGVYVGICQKCRYCSILLFVLIGYTYNIDTS
jgi:hypothetical protein